MTDVPARARPSSPLPTAPSTGAVFRFFDTASPEGLFVLSAVPLIYVVNNFGTLFRSRQTLYLIAALLPLTSGRPRR